MTYTTTNIAGGDYRSATSIAVKVLILQTFLLQTLREVIIALLAVPSSKSPQHRSCRAATYRSLFNQLKACHKRQAMRRSVGGWVVSALP